MRRRRRGSSRLRGCVSGRVRPGTDACSNCVARADRVARADAVAYVFAELRADVGPDLRADAVAYVLAEPLADVGPDLCADLVAQPLANAGPDRIPSPEPRADRTL